MIRTGTAWRRRAVFAFVLAASAIGAAGAQDDDAVFNPVVDATVRVTAVSTGREGTGWVIEGVDSQNRAGAAVIVTSYNIIEGSSQIRVREPGSTEPYLATVLGTDSDRNLAFLEVKDIKAHALSLTRTTPSVGRDVWAAGYNKRADEAEGDNQLAANASLQHGSLSRELRGPISTEARAEVNQLEYGATLLPGFEGGPVVDRCARVIGVTMKSGDRTMRRADLLIQPSAAVMNALKSDEIIKAARDNGVTFEAKDGPCGASAAVGAKPQPVEPVTTAPPPNPGLGEKLRNLFGSGSTTLLALLALGLAAIGIGIYMVTRKGQPAPEPDRVSPPPPPPASEVPGSRDVPPTGGTTRNKTTAVESQLRLSGRGPGGEPIDLNFSSGEIGKRGVMLGCGANADVRIPDNRPEYRVSRLHARIAHDGKTFTIEDNKSLNKTMVGDREIESHAPTPLVNGDRIKLADIELAVGVT
jgi:hypothetical protein